MTPEQADNFVKKILQGYYPRWKPSDLQIEGWTKRLEDYDYDLAEAAIETFCFSAPNNIDPPAAKILKAINSARKIIPVADRPPIEILFDIECLVPPEDKPFRLGQTMASMPIDHNRTNDPDHCRACAETFTRHYSGLQNGTWGAVEREKDPPDSGLRYGKARDKAFADILNGPDDKRRRWLVGYLEQQMKKAERKKREEVEVEVKGPQRIGEIVTI